MRLVRFHTALFCCLSASAPFALCFLICQVSAQAQEPVPTTAPSPTSNRRVVSSGNLDSGSAAPVSANPEQTPARVDPADPHDSQPAPQPTLAVSSLPNAPGWTLPAPPQPMPPCPRNAAVAQDGQPCIQVSPYHRFLDNTTPIPLTPKQKAYLAIHNFKDPGNIITIVGNSAFTVGVNSHTAYGPGWKGFGRDTGYSFSQDATGEFFGTFLIPSLLHEDPHYHREPKATVPHRIVHAISRTFVAQHDDGRMMPNYAVLLTYPISAEISNLYVPGIHGNAPSTAERIATGIATDPVGNIITEFLPDIAKRINIHALFVQRILNAVTAGSSAGSVVAGP